MAGIYVHVPFCHAKCGYCGFYSSPRLEMAERFVDALLAEWDWRREEFLQASGSSGKSAGVSTVYFGGGTPSALPPRLLDRLTEGILGPLSGQSLCEGGLREFTVEANPEDVAGGEFVRWVASSPVDRVSMGVQTLDDRLLKAIGRRHTAAQALEAVGKLRTEGDIRNLSLDLIYGLPGQSAEAWEQGLRELLDMNPEHLSAYLLSYEPGTRLNALLRKGAVEETDEATAERMYRILCTTARERGYTHYEISNFALPGREAVHNSSYWDMTPYIGLGPGAHSFDGHRRGSNPPKLKEYLERGGHGCFEPEEENETERANDRIITGLRTLSGLNANTLDLARRERLRRASTPWVDGGKMSWDGPRLRIHPDAWLISDAILVDLIE